MYTVLEAKFSLSINTSFTVEISTANNQHEQTAKGNDQHLKNQQPSTSKTSHLQPQKPAPLT